MKKIDRIQAENFLKSRKIHKNLRRVIALLAAFVMLFTVNTLKRNANTLSRYPMCGMDEHIHGASCFDEAGNLICLIPEHEHTDACYQESPDYVPEELEIDLPVDDEGTEPEDDIPEDGYVELGAEEIKPFNLEAPVLLSEMVSSLGMNVDLSRVIQVGAVENDDAHSGMVAAEPLDGDWRISSLRSFNDAELAVITTDDILIIPLTAGAPETPEAPEAPEAPAEPEPVEGDGLDEGAPADENVATDGNDAGDENQTEVGSEETGDGNVEQEQTEVSTGDAENTGDETEIETTGDENKENEVEQPVEEVIEQPIENVIEQPIENVVEQPIENVAEQVADNTDNNEAGQVAVDAPEQPAEENADDQQVEEVKEVEVELGGDDETQQADDDATEQGDDVEQTVEGDETEQTVEGGETEQTVEGDEIEQTVEGGETEQTVEGDEIEQTVEGGETEQTVEGDETEQSDEDDETKEEAQPAEVVTAQIEDDTDNNEEVEKIEADEADKSDEAEDKADEETADEADKSDEAGKSDEAEDKSDDETADEAEKSDEDAEKADEAEKSDEDAEKADEDTEKSDEEGDETDEDADLEDEQGEDAEQGDEIGDEEGDEADETTDGEATEVAAPSVSVTVDLSSVDLMDSASIEADTVKLSVADLLTGADDAVEVNGDLVVDNETFAAAADVTAAENVDVQDGVITLSAEALETGVVVLEISTVTQPEAQPEAQSAPAEDAEPAAEGEPAEDAEPVEAAEPEPVVTTQTVEIQLTGYTGRTTDDIGDEGQQVTITPADGNSLPADATANVEQVEAPEELKAPEEPQENVLQDAVAYEITITNANNDEISETGEVAVKLNTPDLNVLEGLPEGTEADKVHLELIHIDDDGNATPVENAVFDHDPVTGEVRSVSFTTESFSTYMVRYTVDFTYVDEAGEEHFWQFPGIGSRALREVLGELGIKGEAITEATLKMTELVDECGDKDLYLTQEEETGEWFIHSEAAFDDTYELAVTVDGTKYVVTVTDAITAPFTKVQIDLLGTTGTAPVAPVNGLPRDYNVYVVATLNDKTTGEVKGFTATSLSTNALNDDGTWYEDFDPTQKTFYYKNQWGNWNDTTTGYSPSQYDLDLKFYMSRDGLGNDSSVYRTIQEKLQYNPDIIWDLISEKVDNFVLVGSGPVVESDTAILRLRQYIPKTYGMRVYLTAPGQAIAQDDYYVVRVKISKNGTTAFAIGKLAVEGSETSSTPVELELVSDKTQDQKPSFWYNWSSSQWLDIENVADYTVEEVAVLKINNNQYSMENLRKQPADGSYTVVAASESVKGYTWAQASREYGELDEAGNRCTYDVINLTPAAGTLSVGEIKSALRDASNFGFYVEELWQHAGDMEANIGAGKVVSSLSLTGDYGFTNNNILVNQLIVTKHWTDSNGDPLVGATVNLKLYPLLGYNENSGAYTGLGAAIEGTGTTDGNGVAVIKFNTLPAGHYILKEVLANGEEKSFENANSNGVVSLGGNKTITFTDGVITIDNRINVNENYFGTIENGVDLANLIVKSRHGVIVSDNAYEKLNTANQALDQGARTLVYRTGSTDYPRTFNIPEDMKNLRALSTKLATEHDSASVLVLTKTPASMPSDYFDIDSNGKFVVLNYDVTGCGDSVTLHTNIRIDGVPLVADFGKNGNELADKLLINVISNGQPYTGTVNTDHDCAGVLLVPSGTCGDLGGPWGGTIVAKIGKHTGNEIHSDSANKQRKINTMIINADREEDVGNLSLEKQTIGDIAPENTTWFTFKVTLKNGTTPIRGTFPTTLQRNGDNTITFDANGEATIQVRANNKVVISGLPTGATYTVQEQLVEGNENYSLGWYEDKDGNRTMSGPISGQIKKGETVIAKAVNVRKVGGLTVTKKVVGDETNAKKFTFRVTILNNEGTAPDTSFTHTYGRMVFNEGVATFRLGNGEYCTAENIPTGTKFKVEEIDHDQNGFDTICDVTVTGADASIVTKNTDKSVTGEIVAGNAQQPVIIAVAYTNTHTNEATYSPKVTKVLQQIGEDENVPVKWPAEGFTFTLREGTDPNGRVLGTATATKDSPIASFDAITYTEPGEYHYTITETVPDDAVGNKKDGITYHPTPVTVTVNVIYDDVTDPEHPTYKINSVQYGNCEAVTNNIAILFASGSVTNDYESVEATPKAQKVLNGVAFTGKRSDGTTKATFTFDLKEVNNNGGSLEVGDILQTVTTGDDGLVSFEALDYIVPGVHIYEISERQGSEPRIRYDDTKVYWKVVVDGTGDTLHISDGYYSDIGCGDQYKLTDNYATFRNNELTKVHLHKSWYLNGQAAPNDYILPEYIQVKLWRKGSGSAEVVDLTGKTLPEDSSYDSSSNVLTLRPITKTVGGQAYLYWTWDIDGLDAYYNGTSHPYEYYFEEVSVPDGWTVVYSKEENGTYDPTANTKAIVGGGNFYMRNSRYTAQLPATGGVGTTAVYVGGSGLLLLAILGWLLSARKRRE